MSALTPSSNTPATHRRNPNLSMRGLNKRLTFPCLCQWGQRRRETVARQRRRLQAHERLERDRRQGQRAAEALHQALEDLACQKTWWWRSSRLSASLSAI